MTKVEELRKKSAEDLRKALQESRAKVVDLRFSIASGNAKGISQLHKTKLEIARIHTLLRQISK